MTQMSGNPHYTGAEEFLEDAYFHEGEYSGLRETQIALQRAQIQATLALAYEQRTVNLELSVLLQAQARIANMIFTEDLAGIINHRLGIDEEGNPTE